MIGSANFHIVTVLFPGIAKIHHTSYAQRREYKYNLKENMKSSIRSRGFSHHLILPVLALVAVGAIGLVTLRLSSAATATKSCTGLTFGRYKNNPANGGKYVKYKSCVQGIQKKVGIKGDSVDGIYGNYTLSKVQAWQVKYNKSHSAKLTTDGVVGSKTWAAMGIHPTYKVEVSTTKRYAYQKCTYKYFTSYLVSFGPPPQVKCSAKTTTSRATADNVVEINRSMFNNRSAHVKLYNNWLEKRTGGDQKGIVAQQAFGDALKINFK